MSSPNQCITIIGTKCFIDPDTNSSPAPLCSRELLHCWPAPAPCLWVLGHPRPPHAKGWMMPLQGSPVPLSNGNSWYLEVWVSLCSLWGLVLLRGMSPQVTEQREMGLQGHGVPPNCSSPAAAGSRTGGSALAVLFLQGQKSGVGAINCTVCYLHRFPLALKSSSLLQPSGPWSPNAFWPRAGSSSGGDSRAA